MIARALIGGISADTSQFLERWTALSAWMHGDTNRLSNQSPEGEEPVHCARVAAEYGHPIFMTPPPSLLSDDEIATEPVKQAKTFQRLHMRDQ